MVLSRAVEPTITDSKAAEPLFFYHSAAAHPVPDCKAVEHLITDRGEIKPLIPVSKVVEALVPEHQSQDNEYTFHKMFIECMKSESAKHNDMLVLNADTQTYQVLETQKYIRKVLSLANVMDTLVKMTTKRSISG